MPTTAREGMPVPFRNGPSETKMSPSLTQHTCGPITGLLECPLLPSRVFPYGPTARQEKLILRGRQPAGIDLGGSFCSLCRRGMLAQVDSCCYHIDASVFLQRGNVLQFCNRQRDTHTPWCAVGCLTQGKRPSPPFRCYVLICLGTIRAHQPMPHTHALATP